MARSYANIEVVTLCDEPIRSVEPECVLAQMPDRVVCWRKSDDKYLSCTKSFHSLSDAVMGDSRCKESPQKRTGSSPDYEFEKTNLSMKRPRTREDFMEFCCAILAYSQYEPFHQEELRQENNMSPVDMDSGGSMSENYMSESSSSASCSSDTEHSSTMNSPKVHAPGEDAELVTCFCLKPYANRPMIECSECLQWIHFSCAKIRKSNIPDTFVCQPCRDAKYTVRKSDRRRTSSKRLTI